MYHRPLRVGVVEHYVQPYRPTYTPIYVQGFRPTRSPVLVRGEAAHIILCSTTIGITEYAASDNRRENKKIKKQHRNSITNTSVSLYIISLSLRACVCVCVCFVDLNKGYTFFNTYSIQPLARYAANRNGTSLISQSIAAVESINTLYTRINIL